MKNCRTASFAGLVAFALSIAVSGSALAQPQNIEKLKAMKVSGTDLNINGTHTRKNVILNELMRAFRNWDRKAASRVDKFAAISHAVSGRIAEAYQREAPVIYPPVEVEKFHPNTERERWRSLAYCR